MNPCRKFTNSTRTEKWPILSNSPERMQIRYRASPYEVLNTTWMGWIFKSFENPGANNAVSRRTRTVRRLRTVNRHGIIFSVDRSFLGDEPANVAAAGASRTIPFLTANAIAVVARSPPSSRRPFFVCSDASVRRIVPRRNIFTKSSVCERRAERGRYCSIRAGRVPPTPPGQKGRRGDGVHALSLLLLLYDYYYYYYFVPS